VDTDTTVCAGNLSTHKCMISGRDIGTYRTAEDVAILICVKDTVVEVDYCSSCS
jgi:hypothetical protein